MSLELTDKLKSFLGFINSLTEPSISTKPHMQCKSPIIFLISFFAFSLTIYQTLTLFNCLILFLGALCIFLLSDTENLFPINSLFLKGLLITTGGLLLLHYVPKFSVIAPNFLLIIPLMVLYFTKDPRMVFLTFSIQLFLNNFFLEPNFIEMQTRTYSDSFYYDFFSAFKLFSFIAFGIQLSFLTQTQKASDSLKIEKSLLLSKLNEYETQVTQLKEALDSKEHMLHCYEDSLHTFAHECRNPLHGVQSNLELAEAMLGDRAIRETLNLDKIEKFVHNSRICGEFLLQYLNNILDAGKIESNTIDINPTSSDIKILLEKVWAICCESIRRKNLLGNLKLKVDVPPFLLVDAHRIIQILVNLTNNAVKFTSKGIINISVEWKRLEDFSHFSSFSKNKLKNSRQLPTFDSACFEDASPKGEPAEPVVTHSKTLSIGTAKNLLRNEFHVLDLHQTKFERSIPLLKRQQTSNKGLLIIEVKDSGCGMSREDLSKLFLKFSQVNPDPSKRRMGTGLGLWLCQQIAQKMSGTIEAESILGVGSLFRVKIPAEVSESPLQRSFKHLPYARASNSEKIDEAIAKKKVKAIVVDDVTYNREVHKLLLKKCECEIICEASTGKSAVEQFKKYAGKLDLVVIDLEMPEMGGLEACRQIRLYERSQNIKASYIVVISSGASIDEVEKISDSEKTLLYDYYVKKPCPLSEFQKICGEALVKSMTKLFASFSPKPALRKTKKKVLLVDDDVFSLDIARNFFSNAQIETTAAMNGTDGIQTLMESLNEIGCVVMDYEMPDMDGKQALLKMRAYLESQKIKDLPIFCASGNTGANFVQEMKNAGFNEVYAKPINWKKLILSVKRELDTI